MEISEIQMGTKLELEAYDEKGNKLEFILVSEYEWHIGNKTIMIAAPIYEGIVYPLRLGAEINVYFIKRTGYEYELFLFKAIVSGREINENIPLLKIDAVSEVEKVQRRQYYRMGCSLPVRFRIVDSDNNTDREDVKFRNTIAVNLSGGGICLLLEEIIDIGRRIECELFNEDNFKIKFLGKVTRYEESMLESKYKYKAGIIYININNSDREAVVKFIFNEQRKLRKKGLI